MSVWSRVKTWVAGETLTAADLNAEFDNFINNNNIISTGANTFSLTKGTASLDVATGKTVNIDDDVTISAELHVEAATHVNQDTTSDAGPTFDHVHLTSGQIGFPATQVASADANTLDDYEEGTWTPTIKFGGASVDVTYGAETAGKYTKEGNAVHLTCYLELTNKGSSAGAATIGGLPFAISGYSAAAIGYVSAITFANIITAYAVGSLIYLSETTEAGVRTDLANTDFANNSIIILEMTYLV